MSTPLPPLAQCNFPSENTESAYRLVLKAESEAVAARKSVDIMSARVVGWLLVTLHNLRATLSDAPVGQISRELRSGKKDTNVLVYDLGVRYRELLLRAFRQSKGWQPTPSTHPSRPSFSTLQDMIDDSLEGSRKTHQSAKKRALARDGFRCMITGTYDLKSIKMNAELRNKADEAPATATECCHILSESTLQDVEGGTPKSKAKREYASAVLAVLETFGLGDLIHAVLTKSGGVHDLSNILTLRGDIHTLFDNLGIWLESTGRPNEYRVHGSMKQVLFGLKSEIITFEDQGKTQKHPNGQPLPDPRLLAIHAACARVAHMSGVAEYIDSIDEDVEDTKVLSSDGSSAQLLFERLSSAAILVA